MDKKIVFLCEFYGSVHRGVETYVSELSKRLSKNYHVEIISGKPSNSFKKIINGNFDIVIPTNGRLQALFASLGRFKRGYKTIISGQSGIGRDDVWNIFFTFPDIYVALTDYELNWAKKWAWKTRLVKIPNGVDLKKFSQKGKKIKFDVLRPVILSVGALTWYKHHELAIKAVAKLKSGSLIIVGKGAREDELDKLGNSLLGNGRFKIIKSTYADIPKIYRSADVFTLPSWNREAFGIVYLEAMASGLPVVAPDDPPRKEIIGDGGILVDVTDESRYANALFDAINKKWENLPRKQSEKFSWDNIADQYNKLIKSLI